MSVHGKVILDRNKNKSNTSSNKNKNKKTALKYREKYVLLKEGWFLVFGSFAWVESH